ncbi:ParA family protein [Myxococcota bacterium]|nr:ParA family protein [Myxococcota bacterium]
MTLRFHDALDVVLRFLEGHAGLGDRRLVVRDLRGRIRVLIADRDPATKGLSEARRIELERLAPVLHRDLGPWSPGEKSVLADASVLLSPEDVWKSRESVALDSKTRLLERTVLGQDWLLPPLPNAAPTPPRVVLFGLKGGVGRSTALAVLARHLAEAGEKRVLVIDVDLESPGVSRMLLAPGAHPAWGIVDWFVESAVGQGDSVLDDLAGRSALGTGLAGEILVVPAAGRRTGPYIPKLARVYQGLHDGSDDHGFGGRVAALVDGLERHLEPDVVLIDSRAGLHDIAAVSLTRLGATGLLFAVDTSQTWEGYRMLFEHWQRHAASRKDLIDRVREGLRMVAGHVPETGRDAYLARFREKAWSLFTQTLYDETHPDEEAPFNFDLDDPSAPHDPLRIYWSRAMQDWDPVDQPDAVPPEQVRGIFGAFLDEATALVLGEDA